ncbi:MAG: AraC family transcriptional regulator [Planctomycetota bacterium]
MNELLAIKGLINVGYYRAPKEKLPSPHLIEDGRILIELITAGGVFFEADGADVECRCGAQFWHLPGEKTIYRSIPGEPYECLTVHFVVRNEPVRTVPRLTVWNDSVEALEFTQTALSSFYDSVFDRNILCRYLAATLYWKAYHSAKSRPDPTLPRALQTLIEELEKRLAEPLSVDDIAGIVGLSASHLHALFRDQLGATPHQYLTERRIQRARQRLATTHEPVKRIAIDCGFQSLENFYRCFKRATTMTPARYRDIHSARPAPFRT